MAALERRKFLQSSIALSTLPFAGFSAVASPADMAAPVNNRFKISLNAYSFNTPLRSGETSLLQMIEFCAVQGFDAADVTGYYFPGYPEPPSDEYIYQLKRKAHQLGVAISGTGVRNDFTDPDKSIRAKDVVLVKKWIETAAKLGAPVIRIFAGKAVPEKFTWEAVADWMTEDIRTCVEHGKKHGVIIALQNHNDFVKTADQTIDLIKRINSEWFGLVLDTGSFVTNEPYDEIKKTISYAVNWQIKEKLNYKGKSENMDLVKLFRIIKASSYRGFLPIETLSPGDPAVIIPPFLKQVREAMEKVMNT
ncbi:MAG: sugar phosphate isomerase/epimerase [Chitinophagaceae bacterium]|nr:sugar phosphate isomerase/epimerase [Chitinophagaceae bacterium]